MKDFALGLGLKQRQKATRKWPIELLKKTPYIVFFSVPKNSKFSVKIKLPNRRPMTRDPRRETRDKGTTTHQPRPSIPRLLLVSLPFSFYLPRSFWLFFFPFFLLFIISFLFFLLYISQQASNSHPSSYLWISCPSATPLHHSDLLKHFSQ